MNTTLATEIARLTNMGWRVVSQTDTSASLEDRGPFNWLLFALSILIFFGIGGLLYVAYWLIASRAHIFIYMDGEQLMSSGDTWLVAQQELDEALSRQRTEAIKQKGFWKVMWPSIVAMLLAMVGWIILIRIF